MSRTEPTTQTVNASAARQHWSQLLNQVFRGQTRVLVEKSGIPVAALVSAEDLERLQRLEVAARDGWAAIERIRAHNTGADPDDVLHDVTAEVESVRREAHERESASRA